MKIFKVFWGDIKGGGLGRLPYLGYSLLLTMAMFGFVLAVIFAIGAGEHLIGGDLQQAQDKLREWFTLPFFVVFGGFLVFSLFGGLNIMAKRIRDIGLSGWWAVLAITVLEGILAFFVSQQTSSGLHMLTWVMLMLIPTNFFTRQKGLSG